MMQRLWCLAAVLLVACGGSDVPSEGDGGSGGASVGLIQSASVGRDPPREVDASVGEGGSTGEGASGGADPETACDAFCEKQDAANCTQEAGLGCADYCDLTRTYAGPCEDLLAESYACLTAHTPEGGCDGSAGCDPEHAALRACQYPPDGTGAMECGDDGVTSTCTRTSSAHVFVSACDVGPAPSSCVCSVDGEVVSSCIDDLGDYGDCCVSKFAEAG